MLVPMLIKIYVSQSRLRMFWLYKVEYISFEKEISVVQGLVLCEISQKYFLSPTLRQVTACFKYLRFSMHVCAPARLMHSYEPILFMVLRASYYLSCAE